MIAFYLFFNSLKIATEGPDVSPQWEIELPLFTKCFTKDNEWISVDLLKRAVDSVG